MGENNFTHYEGQVLAECPNDCGRTYRLKGSTGVSTVYCSRCEENFDADRSTGDVLA